MKPACFLPALRSAIAAAAIAFGHAAAIAADPADTGTGCCCVPSGATLKCDPMTEKDCLAKMPKAPQYDEKTDWAKAEAESAAQEKGKMKAGWHIGKCPP
jgi:hypothetical protein